MYEQKGKLPDCETCLPDLDPNNFDAWRVYQATQNQLIMGFGGPISINQVAVWQYLEKYNDEFSTPVNAIFEKVCAVSASSISDMNEESRLENEANKVK